MRITDWSSDVCSSDRSGADLTDFCAGLTDNGARALSDYCCGLLREHGLGMKAAFDPTRVPQALERKGVVWGKSVPGRGARCGVSIIQQKYRAIIAYSTVSVGYQFNNWRYNLPV